MKVVDLVQRSPAWHEWRSHGVSASDAATILGISPHKTPWRLWAEKTGRIAPEDLSANPNVRRGVTLEDIARQAVEQYKQECGTVLLPVCAEHDSMSLLRASLDGLNERGEPVELKCPADSTFEAVKAEGRQSEAFRLYYPQVQYQMLVVGASRGFLVFYTEKDGGELLTFELDLDVVLVSELTTKATAFWESVQQDKAPEMDASRDILVPSGKARKRWDELAKVRAKMSDALGKEKRIVKTLESDLKANEAELVELMGNFSHAAGHGLSITRYEQQGGVDYPKLLAEQLPDFDLTELDTYRKKGSTRVRVTKKDTSELEQAAATAANAPPVALPTFDAEEASDFAWGAKFAW